MNPNFEPNHTGVSSPTQKRPIVTTFGVSSEFIEGEPMVKPALGLAITVRLKNSMSNREV